MVAIVIIDDVVMMMVAGVEVVSNTATGTMTVGTEVVIVGGDSSAAFNHLLGRKLRGKILAHI